MTALNERLRAEREKTGLTQAELAKEIGVTTQSQGNYERGVRKPDADYFELAAKLGLDINYIITGVKAGATSLGAKEEALLALYKDATPALKSSVMGMLATGVLPGGVTNVVVGGINNKAAGKNLKEKQVLLTKKRK